MPGEVDARERLAAQTARNLEGLELERAGQLDAALALYQQNVDQGFEGDWPYARLIAAYEKRGELLQAVGVLERAIEVFSASTRRTPTDRRATVSAFKGRLRLVLKKLRRQQRPARRARSSSSG